MASLPLIHIVADYGTGDLAFTEVIQRFKYLLPTTEIFPISTPPFSTLNTGFIISQLALYNPSHKLFIYSNTAPRKDDSQIRNDNEGEQFKYALLTNGVEICGVDAGYCFSFVKSHIKAFNLIKVQNKGSQFRSRDFYPQAAAGIINGQHNQYLGKKITHKNIPDIPQNKIMHVDSYGNIKTTILHSSITLQPGQKIRVVINHIFQTGIYANGNFAVKSGDLAFAPGSSGGKNSFMEIFLRSGNASRYFGNPPIETKIKIETF
ncbi:MAG: SAM hydroxide adenosyltransferase [Patescibacteria group bacterium]|nr:SAM hydroxide adenosyltransferase [Patescibacteria group bacterium]